MRAENITLESRSVSLGFDVERIRQDFPILKQKIKGKTLIYLDNAATTQKPEAVLEALRRYYTSKNSNVHRGVHWLSEQATRDYEAARHRVKSFLNAGSEHEIIFVRGATEAINLVAHSFGRKWVQAGDEIVISAMEHHSNIVPWQILCEEKGAALRVAPINDEGEMVLEEYEKLLNSRTRLVAVTHVSNALGTVNPIRSIIQAAHSKGIPVLIDGAQAAPHLKVDVQELGCEFYVFSGHKIYGPTGIGVLYGKERLLDQMPPYQGGGEMIRSVTFQKTIYNQLPYKFEAGTPHIAGAIGLAAAIDYVNALGLETVAHYEQMLLAHATEALAAVRGVRIIGTAQDKAAVVSFVLDGVHAHDVGTILDQQGIAIRAGHHCAMPVMERFGVSATARVSLAFYNTRQEIDAVAASIHKVREVFG
ncbi:MAG: cysteine desulfurase [Acidobacteria bacterium]|nr:cysteine desulfurase [Acidobacteriota bacterium]